MAAYQLLSCDIALGADMMNVVARHAFHPVTYAEMLVLRYIHGENSVTNIYDVGAVERDDQSEMARLCETYGADLIKKTMFPGAGTRLPRGDNRFGPAPPRVVAADASNKSDPVMYEPGQTDFNAPEIQDEYAPSATVITDADPFESSDPAPQLADVLAPDPVPVPVPAPIVKPGAKKA